MRKMKKQHIAENLLNFDKWERIIRPRIQALSTPGASKVLSADLKEIRLRITVGRDFDCIQALILHVSRQTNACERGLYKQVEGSSWHLA